MNEHNSEILDIYDIYGNHQNRAVLRGEPLKEGEYHLVVQIWIKNKKGEYLIQKRSENIESLPGIWATTAGAVLAGETSLAGAIRELAEELGIKASPHELQKILQSTGSNSLGTAWLLERDIAHDKISVQKEEVSAIMWATEDVIKSMVEKGSFYDYGDEYFRHVFSS